MRREDADKVQSLEAALQESQAELKAEKLLLQQVGPDSSPACLPVVCMWASQLTAAATGLP